MQSPLIVRVDLAGTWKGRYVIGADGVTRVPDGAEGTKRIDWIALCFDLPSNGAPHYDAKFAFTDDATGTLIRRLLLDVAAVPLDFDVTESTPYIRVKHIMGGVVGAPSAFPSSGTFAFDS